MVPPVWMSQGRLSLKFLETIDIGSYYFPFQSSHCVQNQTTSPTTLLVPGAAAILLLVNGDSGLLEPLLQLLSPTERAPQRGHFTTEGTPLTKLDPGFL